MKYCLRIKYKLPTVSIDMLPEGSGEEPAVEVSEEDAPTPGQVRREVAYLAKLQRDVIVRHYLQGQKVQAIADELGVPKGTVLSRLSSGREQMRISGRVYGRCLISCAAWSGLTNFIRVKKSCWNITRCFMCFPAVSIRRWEELSMCMRNILSGRTAARGLRRETGGLRILIWRIAVSGSIVTAASERLTGRIF